MGGGGNQNQQQQPQFASLGQLGNEAYMLPTGINPATNFPSVSPQYVGSTAPIPVSDQERADLEAAIKRTGISHEPYAMHESQDFDAMMEELYQRMRARGGASAEIGLAESETPSF